MGGSRPETGYPYLDEPGVIAMAHRGGAQHPELRGLENTMHAFRHAVALGYRYLETDVHLTLDGHLMACHDEDLVRVAGTEGLIADLVLEEVARARIGGEHPVPELPQLLEEFPDCFLNIDLKSPGTGQAVADLIAATGWHDRICVGSFSLRRTAEFRRLTSGKVATAAAPSEVAAFMSLPVPQLRRLVQRRGIGVLQVPPRRGLVPVVSPGLVRRSHAAGAHVHVWTVDEPAEMHALLDLGVDGLITDRTDVLKDVLEARGEWRDRS